MTATDAGTGRINTSTSAGATPRPTLALKVKVQMPEHRWGMSNGQSWPTPTASDIRSGTGAAIRTGHAPSLNVRVQGRLNPTWVEIMQGFPPDWTALD